MIDDRHGRPDSKVHGPLSEADGRPAAYGFAATEEGRQTIAALRRAIDREVFPLYMNASALPDADPDPYAYLGEALFRALLAEDRMAFERLERRLIEEPLPVDVLDREVVQPVAKRLGESWCDDSLDFASVTLAASRLQAALPALLRSAAKPRGEGRRTRAPAILLCRVQGDEHTLGLPLLAARFEAEGWEVAGGLALESGEALLAAVAARRFDAVGIAIGSYRGEAHLRETIEALRARSANPDLAILLGGAAVSTRPDDFEDYGADGVCVDVESALSAAGKALSEG